MEDIKTYYQNLAVKYDSSRFGGTYGQYIHRQESNLLRRWIGNSSGQEVLDLACGTGRHLDFATHGLDQSSEMIIIAAEKNPTLNLVVSDATDTKYSSDQFDLVFSFHFIMHLNEEVFLNVLKEVFRILKPSGRFIFDFPSKKRRVLTSRKPSGWHGDYALYLNDLEDLLGEQWKINKYEGILAIPIHRIPPKLRMAFRSVDQWLCRSFFKGLASYLVVEIEKR